MQKFSTVPSQGFSDHVQIRFNTFKLRKLNKNVYKNFNFIDQSLYKNFNSIDQINMVSFVPLVNFVLHTNYINRY